MNEPRVSVLIPTRNSEKYLREAINSILEQTFSDIELLVVDDNSSDDTRSILSSYGDPRIVILDGPGKGLAAALNFGLRQAKGEFVARMDADDIADVTRLQKQVEYLDRHPHLGLCGTLFQQFMDGNAIHEHMENVKYADLLEGCYIGHPTAMLRRKIFIDNELFYNESMKFSEDYDLWTRAIRVTEIGNVQENLLRYRRHGESASVSNIAEMTGLDVDVKIRMIEYLVGGIEAGKKDFLRKLITNQRIIESDREEFVTELCDSIRFPSLCSRAELLSYFHRLDPFRDSFFRNSVQGLIDNATFFVISFNQLTYLKNIVEFFIKNKIKNVIIIDNASSYPPLLAYLDTIPFKVHRMTENYGHMVLFENETFKEEIDKNYFFLTDPDVLPVPECPNDFSFVFMDILLRNNLKNKVGFSLKIDDLPNHYELRDNVVAWESRFFNDKRTYKDIQIYDSPIDTTFALYRPRREWRTTDFFAAFRVGAPYMARHLPWYRNLSKMTDEELFYKRTDKGSSNWNGTMSSDELHKKYGTGDAENCEAKPAGLFERGRAAFRSTRELKQVGALRGYFLFGRFPLVNKKTEHYSCITTTVYAFGAIPLVSKSATKYRFVYRLLGVLPVWTKRAG
ncbi:glycosyltransferase [Bosea sp. ASV33]|uniref:glycosyltransferase family 2 protein n=1 Tax=Bosea sp. ASV33 TaxID=2795106 RepID=UPI0018EDB1D6|nr:glycosyltransferase [Bosea sp. ASV33]